MNILIVGGAGYIGVHVCHAFIDAGAKVSVFDNFSSGSRINIPNNVAVIEGNITDAASISRVIAEGWDGVVHLAALKSAELSMQHPQQYSVNNISGTINLLNALIGAGCPPLVFSSSAAVFGEPVRLPLDEDHPKKPANFYGHTKLEIERLLHWYDGLKELRSASLRYFNAAGYDAAGRVTEPEKDPQNLLPILMEAAAGMREEFIIYGDDYNTPDGTCIRDYVHVEDLADAHVLAMRYLHQEKTSLWLNLGSESGISVLQMLQHARRITGKDIPHRMGNRRPGDSSKLIASSVRAKKVLGWKPSRSDAETLISSTWEIYKQLKVQ